MHTRCEPQTAARLLSSGQAIALAVVLLVAIAECVVVGPLSLLRTAVALVIVFYVLFVALKLALWWAATGQDPPDCRPPEAHAPGLPRYTILVPLCGEAGVVGRLVDALSGLRYAPEKLEILLLLEEYDAETQLAVAAIDLPPEFRVVVVPDVGPRTKPKACDFGYTLATGDMVVIYDAEDRPEPDQLLRAVSTFESVSASDRRVGCLQARLSFWNARGSWVSSFYWAEYVIHFQTFLMGLARLGLIPPLGGTSNHFRFDALEAVACANGVWEFEGNEGDLVTMWGPWDPYNVTEDADLAFRLALAGYRVEMLASTTYEEAPDTARKAKNQRSRWLQGYAQTGLVHTRHPLHNMRVVGPLRYLAFILLMLGTPFSLMLNPLMWGTTMVYVAARSEALPAASAFVDRLFPAPVYYAGMMVMLVGNALLFYQKLITPLARQQRSELAVGEPSQHALGAYLSEQEYGLAFRLLFTPVWWVFTSVSSYRAVRKLLARSQRSHWDKTPHGHAMATEADIALTHVTAPGREIAEPVASLRRRDERSHPTPQASAERAQSGAQGPQTVADTPSAAWLTAGPPQPPRPRVP